MKNLTPIAIVVTEESLIGLARGINQAHDAAIEAHKSAIEHARRCGELLIRAKAECGHGHFLSWLRENCRVGERQARNYMRVAENWERLKSEASADLTISSALKLLAGATSPAPPANRIEHPELSSEFEWFASDGINIARIVPVPHAKDYYYVLVYLDIENNSHNMGQVFFTARGVSDEFVSHALRDYGFQGADQDGWHAVPFGGKDTAECAAERARLIAGGRPVMVRG